MGELLRLVLVLAAIWFLVYRPRRSGPHGQVSRNSSRSQSCPSVPMLRCARCGVYVPQDEAVTDQGRNFCSREHAALGLRQ